MTVSDYGNPARVREVTQSLLPDGFTADVDERGHGIAIVGPNGRRWPETGYFPARHNLRCHITRQAREDAEAGAPFFLAPISHLTA